MTNPDDQVAIDFEDAHYGRGTRYMSLEDARRLLAHCIARQYTFQTIEAFEVRDGWEVPMIEFGLFGRSAAEKSASSAHDLHEIARLCLDDAAAQPNPFLFKIWVDTVESILAKPPERR